MNRNALNDLLVSYENSAPDNLYEFDYHFSMLFYELYKDSPFSQIPDVPFMFMGIDDWQGMSLRCGVWQYYENGDFETGKLQRVTDYLSSHGENDWADVFASGIHDYANEIYQDDPVSHAVGYPEQWLEESGKIDDWIYENENYIYEWKRRLILDHKDDVLSLANDKYFI